MELEKVEIYKERYETWRHLDRTRYQIIQLTIALCAAALVGFENGYLISGPWISGSAGIILGILWQVLAKVNSAIQKNGEALRIYGLAVGDDQIPDVSKKDFSIFFWIESLFAVFGFVLVLLAVYQYIF
jgi:uncharacterized membrane protein